eukprot:2054316-Prymnesium_polylepis.1
MACISSRGLYRRPHNQSVVIHFLKNPSAMEYANAVLRKEQHVPLAQQQRCCSRMVWPEAARRHPESVCHGARCKLDAMRAKGLGAGKWAVWMRPGAWASGVGRRRTTTRAVWPAVRERRETGAG